jgi:hypothetical protein
MVARHVGGYLGPIDEYRTVRVEIELAVEPVLAAFQDGGTVLL